MTDEDGLMVERLDLSGLSIREDAPSTATADFLEEAEGVLLKWENGGEQMVWEISAEAEAYLMAVDRLQELLPALRGADADRATKALKIAVATLKNEFKHLLAVHTECVDSTWLPESFSAPSFSSTTDAADEDGIGNGGEPVSAENSMIREQSFIIDLLPPAMVSDLSDIARRMVALGHARDCIDTYLLVRKGVFDDSLFLLGVERVSADEIQRMQWESLEPRVKKFIKGMKVTFKVLFASERFLCDEVFAENEDSDACFGEMVNEAALQVLGNFRSCAIGPGSPERLFRLLDMYETLKEVFPTIERTFQGEVSMHIIQEAAEVLDLLGAAVKSTFMELKNAIDNETSRTSVAGGALHPLTRYVMNYLGFLSEYLDTLKELYDHGEDGDVAAVPGATDDHNPNGSESSAEFENEDGSQRSALGEKVMLVLEALMRNVDHNSKLYKDSALSSVFLMNNTHYIVQKVKASELQSVIGDEWLRKQSSLVRFHAMNYQRMGWGKIFSFLRDEGIRASGSYSVSKEVLKDRFRNFNATFEEIHRTQSGWVVPEVKLRDELRVLIADKLLPAYGSFLGRYRNHLEGKHYERYLKYTAEDLEANLNDLFEGASGSMNRRRSFSTGG